MFQNYQRACLGINFLHMQNTLTMYCIIFASNPWIKSCWTFH